MNKTLHGIRGITTRKKKVKDTDLDQEILDLGGKITKATQDQQYVDWLAYALNTVKGVLIRVESLIEASNRAKDWTFLHHSSTTKDSISP